MPLPIQSALLAEKLGRFSPRPPAKSNKSRGAAPPQRALKECPALADDCLAVLIHIDPGGKRRGRIFSDVKRHQRTAAQSLRIGYDRDETAKLARSMIAAVPAFRDAIALEKTTISNRSRKLFTLSALYQANQVLLVDRKIASYERPVSGSAVITPDATLEAVQALVQHLMF